MSSDTSKRKLMFNINCHTSLNSLFGCLHCLATLVVVCCCHEVSPDTWRRCLRALGWSVCMFWGLNASIRVFRSVKAENANALFWKSSETQNFTYLTILKHQNTKTSLNELSKNHWVIALFEIFGSVSKKLQSTVFNDHPVPPKMCHTYAKKLIKSG